MAAESFTLQPPNGPPVEGLADEDEVYDAIKEWCSSQTPAIGGFGPQWAHAYAARQAVEVFEELWTVQDWRIDCSSHYTDDEGLIWRLTDTNGEAEAAHEHQRESAWRDQR